VYVTLKDPYWLGELAKLRAEGAANPSAADTRTTSLLAGQLPRDWRVTGVESGLEPITRQMGGGQR
jgi:hypothetical protein